MAMDPKDAPPAGDDHRNERVDAYMEVPGTTHAGGEGRPEMRPIDRPIRTAASLLSIATALAIIGVVVGMQIRRPQTAEASPPQAVQSGSGSAFTFDTFRDIARAASPGVAQISSTKIVKHPRGGHSLDELFGLRPFGEAPDRAEETSLGSGFVIDPEGYLLTNRHVVEGADEIQVSFPGKHPKPYDAKVIGLDERTDVALLKIEPTEKLTVLPLGDSGKMEAGEWVMAIGNPFGMAGTVTVGVVSFQGRAVRLQQTSATQLNMIQTDAAINPGNSGGPLLNTRGEVIGINTLIISRGAAQSSGVGFAVPINTAKDILGQLKEKGKVARGYLGVAIQDISDDMAKSYGRKATTGAYVSNVTPGSPAEKAGIMPEDLILAVNGKEVEDSSALVGAISTLAPGTSVKLKIFRAGSGEKTISVTLGTFPEGSSDETESKPSEAKLGMSLRDLTPSIAQRLQIPPSSAGVVVVEVEPGEAASDAGLSPGDLIVSVNGTAVSSIAEFETAISKARPAGLARLRVQRGDTYRAHHRSIR